jgi:hypothetical protein
MADSPRITRAGQELDEAKGDVLTSIEVVELACATPVLMQGDTLMNVSVGFGHRDVPRACWGIRGDRAV